MKTTQPRTSYLRDQEHVRRIKEGVMLDKSIPADIREKIATACELIHGALGAHGDETSMKLIIDAKLKKLLGM